MGTSGEINYVVKGTGTVEEVNQEKKSRIYDSKA